MDDIVGRALRGLLASLAATTLLLGLAGCGAGGGAATATGSSGGDPAPESTYLLAEFVARDSNHQFVRVWDPAQPDVAVQSVPIVETNGIVWTSSRLAFADATRYDSATHTVTTLGHAKVFFDNDGKVYAIDLRGGRPHAPVQVSSAADANGIAGAIALDAAGDDAWVDVAGVAHHWAVRATMSATDAPLPMMALNAMRDGATGLPQYLFVRFGGASGTAVQPTSFGVRDLGFRPVALPTVDAMGGYDGWLAPDPARPGLAYLRIAGQLRALRWSAGGVGVDAGGVHQFIAPGLGLPPATADADAVFVADGSTLLRVADGTVSAVGAFGGVPYELADAGGHVVAAESAVLTPLCCRQWETMSKVDGAVALAATGGTTMRLVAAGDAGLVFSGAPGRAGVPQPADPGYRVVAADGALLRTSGGRAAGLVRAAARRVDQPAAVIALLTCAADPALDGCAAGPLNGLDIATGAAMTFGTVTAAGESMDADLLDGLPGVVAGQTTLASPGGFGGGQTDVRDAWQLIPGTAASLARVTSNLP